MEVKAEGMGREMSEKRIESTGRREGLEGRRRKGIYSQQRHVRLHEKELFIQEPGFSHEFPKTQASACVPLLFPPHSLGSFVALLAPQLISHCIPLTPSCLPPDPLSQLSSAGCLCISLTLHSQPHLKITLILWSGRLWGAAMFGWNSTWNSSDLGMAFML